MVFSSLIFLYAFLPLSLLVYVLCRGREAKNMSLLVFSLIFYAWGEPKYVLLLMFMSLCSWFCALRVEKADSQGRRKLWVAVSCAIDIALIGFFKYAGLVCSVFGQVPEFVANIALPIGISFYTFQLLTYVVDVYRGDAEAQPSCLNVLLYASLFHQCVAGPIVRYKTIAHELFVQRDSRDLLSGIITMTGLYSINLRIAGRANLPFFNMDTLFDNALVDSLPAALAPWSKVLVVLVIVLVVKVLLDLFMNTKAGFLLRAEGDNPAVVATLARDGGLVKIEGLIIANALVALSGAVMAQKNRVFEISMGTGAIVFGLAAVIIGTNIFKNRQKVNSSTAAIVGSIIYKACVALALSMGLVPQDLKLVTAALFLIILVLGNVRRKKVKFHA